MDLTHPHGHPTRAPGQGRAATQMLVEQLQTGVCILQGGVICYANPALAELLGWPTIELTSQHGHVLAAAGFTGYVDQMVERCMQDKPVSLLLRCRRRDGNEFDAKVYARRIEHQHAPAVLVTVLDVSELQTVKRRARWNAGMLARTETLCRSGSFEISLPAGELVLSGGLCELVGLSADRATAVSHIDSLHWLPADEQAYVAGFWRNASPGEPFEFQHRVQCADGSRLMVLHRGVVERGADGQLRGTAILQDITAQREAEHRIQELANQNEVTGLWNRAAFLDQVDAAMHAARWDNRGVALLVVEVRRIAEIKTSMGFGAGDSLAMALASRLSGASREGETVGHLGDTEFALLLECPAQEAQQGLLLRARELLLAMQLPVRLGTTDVYPQCLIGMALFPTDAATPDRLLESAQTARSGLVGGGEIAFFKAESNVRVLREMALESALSKAITNGDELLLHYQPQVDLATGRVCGAEALLRWHSKELGVVSPAEFIPVAERTGLIGAVGEWVLAEACRQIGQWQREGLPEVRIGVNLSPMQLQRPDLARHVQSVMVATGADAARLGIEVTEGTLMADVLSAAAVLRDIKSLGVEISLDDFGTGFSSLSSLSSLPIDVVKVDRSFVHDVTGAAKDVSVTRAIISMAQSLQMRVLAEGVETEGQLSLLLAHGCDKIQGFWFSKPLPAAEFERMVRTGRTLPPRFMRRDKRQRTLLLADADAASLAGLEALLQPDGYAIVTARNAVAASQRLADHEVDVIVCGQDLPGSSGLALLQRARELQPDCTRLLLCEGAAPQPAVDAIGDGTAHRFLSRSWDAERLRGHVAEAFLHKGLVDENRRLSRQVDEASDDLSNLKARLDHLAAQRRDQAQLLEAGAGSMRDLVDRLPAAVLGIDTDGLLVFANAEAERLLPQVGSLLGRQASSVLWPQLFDEAGAVAAPDGTVSHQGEELRVVARDILVDGQARGSILMLLPEFAREAV